MSFKLVSKHTPAGDQPNAIKELVEGLNKGEKHQVLLGATGTGKTFTIANVIAQSDRTTLVLSHNKTLAGQLYAELKSFFPEERVEYFVSNFDYYRPEAYMPSSDTFIDKTSKSNWDIEAMRMSAANALVSGERAIVVASVASIYGQITPEEYKMMFLPIKVGMNIKRSDLLMLLIQRNYTRNNVDIKPGTFRSKGDVIELMPAYTDVSYFRLELFGDEIETIKEIEYLTNKVKKEYKSVTFAPASSFSSRPEVMDRAVKTIAAELEERLEFFKKNNKLLEAQRLEQRTKADIESLSEFGVANGIENYSRHFDGRLPGERPYTIFDYVMLNARERGVPPLLVIDESHMMLPQLNAMYNGDRSRKFNLVEYGFRLPSALDNRPLKFEEFEKGYDIQKIYVSATPAEYELNKTHGVVVSQIVRPTGLLDPTIEVVGTTNQVEDIFDRIQKQKAKKERTFILTTTKKMAEELSRYLQERNEKVAYLHSDHKTFERDEILRKLRLGVYDTIIGINLLREGIDIPEISLVLIIDADKESFFRSTSSLIQIIGRAARNEHGHVVMYGDKITHSMHEAITETARRREVQQTYNKLHNITPMTIKKDIPEPLNPEVASAKKEMDPSKMSAAELKKEIEVQRGKMLYAAREMNFERAAQIRDYIIELESLQQ